MTLLSFAVTLFLAILGMVVSAWMHGTSPDMRFAYRHVAIPGAVIGGTIVFMVVLITEIRHYRQVKALAGIARASQ
jgi:hypothetical protein